MSCKNKTLVWMLALAVTGACSDDGDAGAGTEGDSSSGGASATDSASGAMSAGTTAPGTTTGSDTTTAGGSTGMDSAGFINPETTGDSGPTEPQPNGGMCASNDQCTSGYCYQVPQIGGLCSECLVDEDCGTGTCSISFETGYAVCTDGSAGNMCSSDEGCMGDLVCAELFDTGGVINASFCSECGPDTPCADMDVCSPTYDLQNFAGQFSCVAPGSVQSGQGCPVEGVTGDNSVCADGFCEVVDVFNGVLSLGICGECIVDTDCPDGQTCTGGAADMSGLTGSTCG